MSSLRQSNTRFLQFIVALLLGPILVIAVQSAGASSPGVTFAWSVVCALLAFCAARAAREQRRGRSLRNLDSLQLRIVWGLMTLALATAGISVAIVLHLLRV